MSARCTRQLCFQQYCTEHRYTLSVVAILERFPKVYLRYLRQIMRISWKDHIPGCILWRISQRETSSWWTTAAIQRCSQTTPKGYTHHRRQLAWETLAQDRQQWRQAIPKGKSHIEETLSQKYQHDHNLRHGFPHASASIIFCVNCGRGFKSQIRLFSHQRAKHVTDKTLH